MASKAIYKTSSSIFYTIYVTCSVDNSYSDTQAKVTWSSYITFGNWYQWGVRLKTYVNGSLVGNKAQACTSKGQTVCSSSGTVYIDKSTSSKSISFSATSSSETVSGYGGVGSSYTGTASGSFTVNAGVFEYAPNIPTSCAVAKSGTQGTVTYAYAAATNKPVTKTQVAIAKNDGSWVYTTYSNNTNTTHTFSLETNAKYRAAVRAGNDTGWSDWKYSDYVYTTPAAPSSGYGMNNSGNVSLSATVSNINYPSYYEWQRSQDSSFSTATNLDLTGISGTDTHSLSGNVYYRVRAIAPDGTEGDWCSFLCGTRVNLYFWIPG